MMPAELARAYYGAIDAGEYERLADLLAPGFVQRRPDRTFESRDAFVRFMREDRPRTDTHHEIVAVVGDESRACVRGRLRGADGDVLFAFADVFECEDGRVVRLDTYTQ